MLWRTFGHQMKIVMRHHHRGLSMLHESRQQAVRRGHHWRRLGWRGVTGYGVDLTYFESPAINAIHTLDGLAATPAAKCSCWSAARTPPPPK